jgi:hypothetical protein
MRFKEAMLASRFWSPLEKRKGEVSKVEMIRGGGVRARGNP